MLNAHCPEDIVKILENVVFNYCQFSDDLKIWKEEDWEMWEKISNILEKAKDEIFTFTKQAKKIKKFKEEQHKQLAKRVREIAIRHGE
jgi:Txe/YoeB family toxin of Txe-Axe toxin-antitoxin module